MKYYLLICTIFWINYVTMAQDRRLDRENSMATSKLSETLISRPYILEQGQLQLNGDDGNDRKKIQNAIQLSDQKIEEYNQKVSAFMATNPASDILTSKLNAAKIKASGVQTAINQTEKVYKQERSIGYVTQLHTLYLYQAYIQNMSKIYPQEIVFTNYLTKTNEAIASYVSREKFMDQLESNQKNYLKSLTLVPAQQSNPSIEKMVKNEFEKLEGNGILVTKVNITSAQWVIEKNELDLPLYRKMSVSIAAKKPDGSCGIASAMVKEDYLGGGKYGETSMYLPTHLTIIPCENLK